MSEGSPNPSQSLTLLKIVRACAERHPYPVNPETIKVPWARCAASTVPKPGSGSTREDMSQLLAHLRRLPRKTTMLVEEPLDTSSKYSDWNALD
jgi:hypothetical protein